jgi:hypothetical protein
MSTAIATAEPVMGTSATVSIPGFPSQTPHRQATDAASLCKQIVLQTAMKIQGRKYVRVEGWQAICNCFGCVASSVHVERIDGGVRAIGQVRRMSDGLVLAEAEGFVGDEERVWSRRDEYAKRAMAQTRAISRACRSAFAFVVAMMDAGLETTPAEEITGYDGPGERVRVRPKFSHQDSAPAGGIVRERFQAAIEDRGPEASSPHQATSDDMQRARLAINRSSSPEELLGYRERIVQKAETGFFSGSQRDELVALIDGKASFVGEEVTQ